MYYTLTISFAIKFKNVAVFLESNFYVKKTKKYQEEEHFMISFSEQRQICNNIHLNTAWFPKTIWGKVLVHIELRVWFTFVFNGVLTYIKWPQKSTNKKRPLKARQRRIFRH